MKAIVITVLGVMTAAPVLGAATGKVVGQLGMVEGQVLLDNVAVKKNASVREGSVIEVRRGKATLLLGKGSVFYLSPESKMVVSQFGVKPAGDAGKTEEAGELDLKFGRTRALIMNTGADKKELKIRARGATMGVRGTEIYIDAPRDSSRPINFFTLEGKADVKPADAMAPVPVAQNQGVSTMGHAAAPASGGSSAPPAAPAMAPATMSLGEVRHGIRADGMQGGAINTPQDMRRQVTQQYMSDQFGMGALPPLVLDPLQDRFTPVRVSPKFCTASNGTCP